MSAAQVVSVTPSEGALLVGTRVEMDDGTVGVRSDLCVSVEMVVDDSGVELILTPVDPLCAYEPVTRNDP